MPKKLYVGNINYQATEDALKELFAQAGQVVSARLITDAATGRKKGFDFVEMSADSEGDQAIKMLDGVEFIGRKIVVREAKERPEPARGPRREFSRPS